MQIKNNEYVNTINVYTDVVDFLLNDSNLCYFTKEGMYANFKVPVFKTVLTKKGSGENYRYYMNYFRVFSWIICQNGKYSYTQRINGKPLRVITADYYRYLLLKKLLEKEEYFIVLEKFMETVKRIIYMNDKLNKPLYVLTQKNKVLNVKSISFKIILKKLCSHNAEYREYLNIFREFQWIICQQGSFTNIQKINGKAMRVISIDYEKYITIKKLKESH